MKKIIIILLSFAFTMVSCQKYDDSALRETINDHEERLRKLELMCDRMNQDIKALHEILTAIENREYITDITPVSENGKMTGQKIILSSGKELFIRFGKDGKDGNTTIDFPIIAPDIYGDKYYWTIDGKLLVDENGQAVPCSGYNGKDGAEGSDGADGDYGNIPQITIQDGHWWVDYGDGGRNDLGPVANGQDGQDGQAIQGDKGPQGAQGQPGDDGEKGERGDLLFKDILVEGEEVRINLSDGQSFILPYRRPEKLSISFTPSGIISITPGESIELNYSISGTKSAVTVKPLCEHGWKADIKPTADGYTGTIKVTAPAEIIENEVVIMVCEEKGATILSVLTFQTAGTQA